MSLRRTDLDLGLPIPQGVRTSLVTTAPIELLPLRRRRNQQRFHGDNITKIGLVGPAGSLIFLDLNADYGHSEVNEYF